MSIDIRNLRAFSKVKFRGPGRLSIYQGSNEKLSIDAPENLLSQIRSEINDMTLDVGYVNTSVVSLAAHKAVIHYYLEVKELESLTITGSGHVTVPDLDSDSLELCLSGSGNLTFNKLTTDQLATRILGSGHVSLSGDVENQILSLTGSGEYQAPGLISDFARLSILGSGNSYVMVRDELSAEITGSGNITYLGNPEVNKRLLGSGRLIRQRRSRRATTQGAGNGS